MVGILFTKASIVRVLFRAIDCVFFSPSSQHLIWKTRFDYTRNWICDGRNEKEINNAIRAVWEIWLILQLDHLF